MDTRLHPLVDYCESEKVNTLSQLENAPKYLKALLMIHALRPQILKYLKWRKDQTLSDQATGV